MPNKIDDLHPLYSRTLPKWKRCRDFIEGADALRDHDIGRAGESSDCYLPRLSPKQSPEEYEAYVRRALYYNAVGRTHGGFLGLIIGKGADVDIPAAAEPLRIDADLGGMPLEEFLETTVAEVLEANRFGWLIDHPSLSEEEKAQKTRLDVEREGLRPYIVGYKAEDIVNWNIARVGAVTKTVRVVLREAYITPAGKDDFRYRELVLEAGVYRILEWEKVNLEGKEEYALTRETTPLMNNEPLSEIPFFFFDAHGGRAAPQKPALLDLVEINRSHYQSSADLEHARFACSVPTPYFLGFSEEDAKSIVLGGLNGIHATDSSAKVGFLEYTGQGTEPLERALAQKEAMMAKLGSRMLAEDKRDAETAETMRIRASGESATLADVARAVGRVAGKALTLAAAWFGGSGEAVVKLNTEYTAATASPQEITALLAAVQAGEIPSRDFVDRLRKVGVIASERTDEDIEADLEVQRERKAKTQSAGLLAAAAALRASGAAGGSGTA